MKQKETPSLADINDAAMDCRADYENKQLMPRNIEEAFIKGALWYRNKIQQEIENLKKQLSLANEGIWAGDYKNKEEEKIFDLQVRLNALANLNEAITMRWEPLNKLAEPQDWIEMYNHYQELLMQADKKRYGTIRPYTPSRDDINTAVVVVAKAVFYHAGDFSHKENLKKALLLFANTIMLNSEQNDERIVETDAK